VNLTGEFVACTVTDTGHGIAADILPKVFDPFFTTKKSEKGTGLGLSQVHGFAHQSGGTAMIASTPGEGTAVTLYLPRSQAQPEKAAAEPPPQPTPGGRALLVEDNAGVAEVGLEMLGQLGYSVQHASNAHQALAMLDDLNFDLVMSDIVMPGGMNGVELARAIRTVRPELPILLVTGYAGSGTAPEFPVLRKPYRFEQLRQAIAELTGTAPQRDVA
jgi:CheY-like chemotaxis protein